jgi:hypothetical protein
MASSSYVMPVFLFQKKNSDWRFFFSFSIVDGASGSMGDTSLGMRRDKLVNETKREKDESVPWRGRKNKNIT